MIDGRHQSLSGLPITTPAHVLQAMPIGFGGRYVKRHHAPSVRWYNVLALSNPADYRKPF
jgi:hypothetical protein